VRILLTLPQNPQSPGRRLINILIGSKRSLYVTIITFSDEIGHFAAPCAAGTPNTQKMVPVYGVADIVSVIVLTQHRNVAVFPNKKSSAAGAAL
jgi:hypothetical protein